MCESPQRKVYNKKLSTCPTGEIQPSKKKKKKEEEVEEKKNKKMSKRFFSFSTLLSCKALESWNRHFGVSKTLKSNKGTKEL